MNFVPFHIASGAAFFEGIVIVAIALLALGWAKNRILRSTLRTLAAVGIVVVLVSGTPISVWLYVVWCALALFTLFQWKWATMTALVLFSVALCAWESTWRVIPRISVPAGKPIYVIADSVTAGLGRHEKIWPVVLAESSHLDITSVAEPGATVESAMGQARKIKRQPAITILEIGGNDLLGGTNSADFQRQLEALLVDLQGKQQTIVMFELPILPFRNYFGSIQRSLAQKYSAVLIPKKCLVNIFATKGDTVDGLHLSQEGHNAMAALVRSMLVVEPTGAAKQ